MVTFAPVNVTGLAGLQLRFYHHVRTGAGPGMDTDEGAVVQVQINAGAWTTVARVSGYGDFNWAWNATSGGNPSNGCLYTMPNPLGYALPGGTNTFAFRVYSTRGACPAGTASTYDRTDEGLFIDDVQLTTTTAPLPFVWEGSVDTDWHKCANWRYRAVPGLASAVTIDQTAVGHCEVYFANAQCASLSVSTNAAAAWNLTVRTGRQLAVANAVNVTRTGAGPAVGITLGTSGSGFLQCGSLTLAGSAAGAGTAYLRNEAGTNGLLVLGNVIIGNGGLIDLNPGGILQLRGNWANNDGEAAFDDQGSLVWFSGTAAQSIATAGFEERFGSIRMGKTAGDLTLNAPISVHAGLTFAYTAPGGRIFSSATDLLSMESTGTVTGAADGSHVNGPVRKFGTAAFYYPIGKDGVYRPARTRDVVGSATDAFIAEYIHASARVAPHGPLVEQPPLHHVSDCEHWIIERSSGMPTARVELSWHNVLSCGVTDPTGLRVARWEPAGTLWHDRGNEEIATAPWGGWVSSYIGLTEFGSFTLSSVSGENPLPIELVRFDAVRNGNVVECAWVTASERDNDHFTVERSADGEEFSFVGRVEAAGNTSTSVHYDLIDPRPLAGLSYYRLRQTDTDGTSTLSHVVPVRFDGGGITVLNDAGTLHLLHDLPDGSGYRILDAAGRLLAEGRTDGGHLVLPTTGREPALRLIVLGDGARTERVKVVH